MSVPQERKTQKGSSKGHSLSKKKGKKLFHQGKRKSSVLGVPVKENKHNAKSAVTGDIKSNVIAVNKPKNSTDLENDKHQKLKNRKKFKQMKALKNKQKKSERADKQKSSQGVENNVKVTENKTSSGFKNLKGKNKHKERQRKTEGLNDSSSKAVSASPKSMVDRKENAIEDSFQRIVLGKKKLKRILWKQKQMAKKMARKGLVNKQEHKQVKALVAEKVELPKTADEATANWKKLQETISPQTGEKRKRKIPGHRIRNPKHRKVEDWQDENEASEKDANQGDKEPEIWFDDVDDILLDKKPVAMKEGTATENEDGETEIENPLVKTGAFKGVTKVVCMDCEMVGVGDGTEDMLARVSIVNQYGEPVFDKFVKPKEKVVDYRTFVSGVRPQDLENAEDFEQVQKGVADILKGKTLVGHAINNDLKVLYLSHPRKRIRDTSLYKPFRQLSGGRTPSLKKLSEKVLAVKVQEGEHNSIQDAQATMRLYTMYRKQWESELIKQKKKKRPKKGKTG